MKQELDIYHQKQHTTISCDFTTIRSKSDNPGINYDCGNDEIVIEPANGTQLSYVC